MSDPISTRSMPATRFSDLPGLARLHYGDHAFARDDRRTLSYAELDEESDRFAAGLRTLGVRTGDRVALWMTNRTEWLVAQFGVYKAGGCLVSIHTQYKSEELGHILASSEASVLIYEERFLGRFDARAPLSEARHKRGDEFSLREIICLGSDLASEEISFEHIASGEPGQGYGGVAARDPVHIMHTSGSTGLPKGALLSAYGLLTTYSYVGERLKLEVGDTTWLLNVPLSTMFGCLAVVLPCLMNGATIILRPKFDADDAYAAIESQQVTHIVGSPTMYKMLLTSPARRTTDVSSLKGGMIAGAVAPPDVLRTLIEDVGLAGLVNMFGQTEGCGTASMTRLDDPMEKRLYTVGQPLPHVELAIRSLDGHGFCDPGIDGELLGRGRSEGLHAFLGYHRMPEQTAETVDKDGWLHYGDIGSLDEDGYLRVGAGRLKEMYVSGGYNIYPPEVEQLLAAHPDVEEVAVFGVPDDRLGEAGIAYVKLVPGSEVAEEKLRAWCREHIAHYKVPREIVFGENFPVTSSGKVKRLALRDRWLASRGVSP